MSVGVMTVGEITVGVMRRPHGIYASQITRDMEHNRNHNPVTFLIHYLSPDL